MKKLPLPEGESKKDYFETRGEERTEWAKNPDTFVKRDEIVWLLKNHFEQVSALNNAYWDDNNAKITAELNKKTERAWIEAELKSKVNKADIHSNILKMKCTQDEAMDIIEGRMNYIKLALDDSLKQKAFLNCK